jgi:hypothetical protein
MKLFWYHARQNNTGGRFVVNDEVAEDVFFQAPRVGIAEAMANEFLDSLGSCQCCGDRWNGLDDDAYETPTKYGAPYKPRDSEYATEARLHYLNGRIVKWSVKGQTFVELENRASALMIANALNCHAQMLAALKAVRAENILTPSSPAFCVVARAIEAAEGAQS